MAYSTVPTWTELHIVRYNGRRYGQIGRFVFWCYRTLQFFFLDLALSRLKGLSDCSKDKLKGLSIVQKQTRRNVRIHTRMLGSIIKIRDKLPQIWVEASPDSFIEIEQSDFFVRFPAWRDFRVEFLLLSLFQPYHILGETKS